VERQGGVGIGDGVDGGGAVGLPLTSAPSVIGRCLGLWGTVWARRTLVLMPRRAPFYMTLCKREPTATRTAGALDHDA
jgi:hypothetical protein